ncbi:glutathione hydrolase 1 proenzyme-like [Apostichopus japonicus]|uniref:glutathione hydrolase 1 proenzyme-like n=1 Tax=Stichopus japonicus TaxID=307972 RepID=UPI003AB5090B
MADNNDKTQLVTDEKEPIQETTYVREQICGYDGLKFIIVSSILFAIAITVGMVFSIIFGPPQIQPYGAVSSDASICSQQGADILQGGGSAVDAGIATMLCLGVVHFHASGLGGGGFMIIGNPKEQKKEAINFREMSPDLSSPEMFTGSFVEGGMSVGVPGEIAGMRAAWKKYGRTPWQDLFTESINLAKYGFLVTEALAEAIQKVDLSKLSRNLRELISRDVGRVNATQLLYRPDYANLLIKLSKMEEPSLSVVGDEIVELITDDSGIMTLADLVNYTTDDLEVYSMTYQDQEVYSTGAPSNGPMALAILNIMEGYNYTTVNASDPLFYHRFVEALKLSEAYATGLGDPTFTPGIGNFTIKMLSNDTTKKLRKKINDTSTLDLKQYYPGQIHMPTSTYGGSQVVAIGPDGTMVSISSTLNSPFGAKLMTTSGIILNDAMNSFDWEGKSDYKPSAANLLGPSKRPQADLAPLLSWNVSNFCTRRFGIGGVSGISNRKEGGRSAAGVAQVALRLLMGYNITSAIKPKVRVFDALVPDVLEIEDGITNETIAAFEKMYDSIDTEKRGISVVHGVMKEKDQLSARADTRQLGAKAVKFGRP